MRGGEGGRESCLLHCFLSLCVIFIPVENDCKEQVHQKGNLWLLFQTSELLTLGASRPQPGWVHLRGHVFSSVLLLGLSSQWRKHGIKLVALEGLLGLRVCTRLQGDFAD